MTKLVSTIYEMNPLHVSRCFTSRSGKPESTATQGRLYTSARSKSTTHRFGEGSWCTPVWWFEGSVLKQNTSFSKAADKNIQTSSVALKHVQVVLWYVPLVLKMLRSVRVRALEVEGLRSRYPRVKVTQVRHRMETHSCTHI